MDPMWWALGVALGAMMVGGLLGVLVLFVFFKPLYRDDR